LTTRENFFLAVGGYFLADGGNFSGFPKSINGIAAPETWGNIPFHFSMLLYWTRIGLMERERISLALACRLGLLPDSQSAPLRQSFTIILVKDWVWGTLRIFFKFSTGDEGNFGATR
jgi:hypothetical protein